VSAEQVIKADHRCGATTSPTSWSVSGV